MNLWTLVFTVELPSFFLQGTLITFIVALLPYDKNDDSINHSVLINLKQKLVQKTYAKLMI